MMFAPTQRIQAAPNVLYQELDGEAVLLNLNTESYYGLDEVGARMWTLMTTLPSLDSVYITLLDEYEVAPEQLYNDLQTLIGELANQRLIQVEDGALV